MQIQSRIGIDAIWKDQMLSVSMLTDVLGRLNGDSNKAVWRQRLCGLGWKYRIKEASRHVVRKLRDRMRSLGVVRKDSTKN